LDEKLFADIVTKSKYIFDELSSASGVISVCGKGLMIGIKPVKNASDVLKICMENGVLCLTAKDKLRLLPALNIPMESLIKAVGVIKDACKL